VVNHFKIAKKRVKEFLFYDVPGCRKSLCSKGFRSFGILFRVALKMTVRMECWWNDIDS
jgi:hypothetical protein